MMDRRHQKSKKHEEMNSRNWKKKSIESKNIVKSGNVIMTLKVGLNLKGIICSKQNVQFAK